MANIVRVRVELKDKYVDPKKNFNEMFHEFRKRVNNSGIMHDFKDHQYHESSSERDRKKRRDAVKRFQIEAIEEKLRKGEPVRSSQGLVKKVLSSQKREKEKEREKDKKKFSKKPVK